AFFSPNLSTLPHNFITFASRILEALTIFNLECATVISNQSSFAESASSDGNAGPPCPKHVGHKFMRQRYYVAANAVLAHQQPASEPFVDVVEAIARCYLRSLHRHNQTVLLYLFFQTVALF